MSQRPLSNETTQPPEGDDTIIAFGGLFCRFCDTRADWWLPMSQTCRIFDTMSETDPPMTTSELAARLGVDARTVQRKADAGLLPTIGKLPGKTGAYLFDRDAIEALTQDVAA